VLAQLTAVASAGDDRSAKARLCYENGMAHFQLEEYDQAIAQWEEGFRTKPLPEFLFNIGQAYRQSKKAPDKALAFYQKYLRMAPNAENRAEVEKHIESLQKIIDSQQTAAQQPSTQPLPPTGAEHNPPPPSTTPQPLETPASAPPPSVEPARADLTARAPERKPIYKKGWFWGVVVGGAVVVAGAVVVGVLVGSPASGPHTLPAAQF
jgi:tetratricopeptide (TPR) repeat protein